MRIAIWKFLNNIKLHSGLELCGLGLCHEIKKTIFFLCYTTREVQNFAFVYSEQLPLNHVSQQVEKYINLIYFICDIEDSTCKFSLLYFHPSTIPYALSQSHFPFSRSMLYVQPSIEQICFFLRTLWSGKHLKGDQRAKTSIVSTRED